MKIKLTAMMAIILGLIVFVDYKNQMPIYTYLAVVVFMASVDAHLFDHWSRDNRRAQALALSAKEEQGLDLTDLRQQCRRVGARERKYMTRATIGLISISLGILLVVGLFQGVALYSWETALVVLNVTLFSHVVETIVQEREYASYDRAADAEETL